MRRALARQIKSAFLKTGVEALLRRAFPSRYPVIVRYHSVSQGNGLISDGIAVSRQMFEQQVGYFAKHFRPISMDTLIECVQDQKPFPENAIILTFDDGYADNYQAAQILKKYGMTGVFYITAGCIESDERFWVAEIHYLLGKTNKNAVRVRLRDKWFEAYLSDSGRPKVIRRLTHLIKTVDVKTREAIRAELRKQLDDVPALQNDLMLTWQQLANMVTLGMEIGGHTLTHCNLPSASEEEAWNEICESKSLLEQQLGIKVKHFAYPNGGSSQYYNLRIKELVRRAGYLSAVTSKPGVVYSRNDPLELCRIRTTPDLFQILWEIEDFRFRSIAA
jgi:peptidoglycan/xylan/chitin deacetylase (PgdA/CDA1 family)